MAEPTTLKKQLPKVSGLADAAEGTSEKVEGFAHVTDESRRLAGNNDPYEES